MSFYYRFSDPSLKQACDYAYDQGILLIAASGNAADSVVYYPARYDSVVAVGAVDQNDEKWFGSNYGWELELAAPGVHINSTWPPDTYLVNRGTSMAVPHVTGTAALVFGSKVDVEYDQNGNGRWDNFEVRLKLNHTALDLGGNGWDGYYGYGLVNAWYSSQRPPGDINYDYIVQGRDVAYVAEHWGKTPEDPDWWKARVADININKKVGIYDLTIVAQHYGQIDP